MLMVIAGQKIIGCRNWLAARFQHHVRLIPPQRCNRCPPESLQCSKSRAAHSASSGLPHRIHIRSHIIRTTQRILREESDPAVIVPDLHALHPCLRTGSKLACLIDVPLHCGHWRCRASHSARRIDRRCLPGNDQSRTGYYAPCTNDQLGPHHWPHHCRVCVRQGMDVDVLDQLNPDVYDLAVSDIASW